MWFGFISFELMLPLTCFCGFTGIFFPINWQVLLVSFDIFFYGFCNVVCFSFGVLLHCHAIGGVVVVLCFVIRVCVVP